jgi:hypothetical protein
MSEQREVASCEGMSEGVLHTSARRDEMEEEAEYKDRQTSPDNVPVPIKSPVRMRHPESVWKASCNDSI